MKNDNQHQEDHRIRDWTFALALGAALFSASALGVAIWIARFLSGKVGLALLLCILLAADTVQAKVSTNYPHASSIRLVSMEAATRSGPDNFYGLAACAVVVILVGGVVVLGINSVCDKYLGTNQPPRTNSIASSGVPYALPIDVPEPSYPSSSRSTDASGMASMVLQWNTEQGTWEDSPYMVTGCLTNRSSSYSVIVTSNSIPIGQSVSVPNVPTPAGAGQLIDLRGIVTVPTNTPQRFFRWVTVTQ